MYDFNILESLYDIKNEFSFLQENFGFYLNKEFSSNKGVTYQYSNDIIRINLNYDFRENFFYFKLIRGMDTQYPNDQDFENIKTFSDLAKKNDPNFDLRLLQPDQKQYLDALKLNAQLLRINGAKILRGEEWF